MMEHLEKAKEQSVEMIKFTNRCTHCDWLNDKEIEKQKYLAFTKPMIFDVTCNKCKKTFKMKIKHQRKETGNCTYKVKGR